MRLTGMTLFFGFHMHLISTSHLLIDEVVLVQVRKEDVDNYTPRGILVPCQVRVRWVGDRDDPVKPLSHEIKLVGAKNVFDFLTVTSPIRFIGMFTIQFLWLQFILPDFSDNYRFFICKSSSIIYQ